MRLYVASIEACDEEILSVESRILENHRTVDQDLVSGIHLPATYCLYPDIQGHSFLDQIARVLARSVRHDVALVVGFLGGVAQPGDHRESIT